MFVINLTYKVPIEEVEPHLEAHIAFLKEQYAQGVFLASGRKVPRTGGIILARCESREKLRLIVEQDPFYQHQLADIDIVEFVSTMVGDGLDGLLD